MSTAAMWKAIAYEKTLAANPPAGVYVVPNDQQNRLAFTQDSYGAMLQGKHVYYFQTGRYSGSAATGMLSPPKWVESPVSVYYFSHGRPPIETLAAYSKQLVQDSLPSSSWDSVFSVIEIAMLAWVGAGLYSAATSGAGASAGASAGGAAPASSAATASTTASTSAGVTTAASPMSTVPSLVSQATTALSNVTLEQAASAAASLYQAAQQQQKQKAAETQAAQQAQAQQAQAQQAQAQLTATQANVAKTAQASPLTNLSGGTILALLAALAAFI
jgi:hypothetical protein